MIVDALLGTGFSGEPCAAWSARRCARWPTPTSPVVACDVPSGVDASTGEVAGPRRARGRHGDVPRPKIGLWVAPGKSCAGAVHVIEIGIPDGAPVPRRGRPDRAPARPTCCRGARPDSTKFSSGHVLVCGGSTGLSGAPSMAAEAAMRAGAGYVTACVPARAQPRLRGAPDRGHVDRAARRRRPPDAGRRRGGARRGPAPRRSADRRPGLRAHRRSRRARARPDRAARRSRSCSTPTGSTRTPARSSAWPSAARRRSSRRTRASSGACSTSTRTRSAAGACITRARRRGARGRSSCSRATTRSSPSRRAASPSSRGGAGALATAGTGDVLSGVTAAVLAVVDDPFLATCAAVELHRRAGRVAGDRASAPREGVIASDVIAALPRARAAR